MNRTKKILLIDDEQIMHDLAFAYLEKAGFQLISAYSGEKGLKLILKERPDVVLLDYMMPGMDGEAVFNELRRNPAYKEVRETPVIFLSARGGDEALKQRLIKRGIVAYLQKPFGLRELSNIIDNVFIVNDIRRHNRQLRREVKLTRDFLVQIVQNAPVGIFTTNSSGEILLANRVMQGFLGVDSLEKLYKLNVFEAPLFEKTFIVEGVRHVLTQGKPWQSEKIRWPCTDGDYAILTARFVPLGMPTSNIEGVIGLVEDVTDRERHNYEMQMLAQITFAMQQATDLDQLLHLVLTAITAGPALGFTRAMIFLLDNKRREFYGAMGVGPKDETDAFRIWSELEKENLSLEQFLKRYGYAVPDEHDYLNNLVRSIRFPIREECEISQTILSRRIYRADASDNHRPECKQLKPLDLQEFIAVPMVTSNKLIGMILADNKFASRSISEHHVYLLTLIAGQAAGAIERAHAYQQIEQEKQKLEKALADLKEANERLIHSERLAAIGEMAAHVAHEIRNPLVTIGGFARQLLKKCSKQSALYDPAKIIADEVIRLEQILANVLNFTKLPSPKLVRASITELIQEVSEQLKYELSQQQIRMEVQLQPDLPEFYFDPEKIKQVLFNLLRNSQQSIEGEGIIGIEAYAYGKDCCITVSDNGSGIPQDKLDMIFNPFYTTKEHGTGLGLAISQQIIHDHGGDIKVYSEPGMGTVFKILLPMDIHPEKEDGKLETLNQVIY